MQRRKFLFTVGGMAFAVVAGARGAWGGPSADDRVGLGTVSLRNRFEPTKPKGSAIQNPLILLDVPAYYRERLSIPPAEVEAQQLKYLELASASVARMATGLRAVTFFARKVADRVRFEPR